jgi:methyltransferase-like protein/2-polyprenyl-3-methyl-5-hydroxy-6-metoxy-1,4-benzoquinol methylase
MSVNPYDKLPYPTRSHPAAHVRKLEAIATLFGMHPKPISECRVLELGCASAFNLIPQATEFPNSEFVGVDLSERQIEHGQSVIAKLGLENIELRHTNLIDVDESWGVFDYVLCHGVYSWVPEDVRAKILSISKNVLAPNGVTLVSYNVLPGWRMRGAIREMMTYHVSQIEDLAEQIAQARAVLAFTAENCTEDTAYARMLKEELALISSCDDNYLGHDYLEEDNNAVYFHQFIERAHADGLRYLANSDLASMFPLNLPGNARDALVKIPPIRQQQYIDFISNRGFRSTLLCHRDVDVDWNIQPEVLKKFQLSLATRPEPFESSYDASKPLVIRMGTSTLTLQSPLSMAALDSLCDAWPRSMTIDELRMASIQRLAANSVAAESFEYVSSDDVAQSVGNIFLAGLIDFCVHPTQVANRVSNRPLASPLARLQAEASDTVTNQRHENVSLDEFNRYLIALLDSHHDLDSLTERMQAAIASGELRLPQPPKRTPPIAAPDLGGLVGSALNGLCNASLLA